MMTRRIITRSITTWVAYFEGDEGIGGTGLAHDQATAISDLIKRHGKAAKETPALGPLLRTLAAYDRGLPVNH